MEGTDHEVELHEIEIAIFHEIMTPTLYGYIHSTKSFQIKREKIFFLHIFYFCSVNRRDGNSASPLIKRKQKQNT
jgi:hypothetical protein